MIRFFVIALLASVPLQALGTSELEQPRGDAQSVRDHTAEFTLGQGFELLTDTKGIDFNPYVQEMISKVRKNWFMLMPLSPKLGEQGRNVVRLRILQDGSVPVDSLRIDVSSQKKDLDKASLGAVQKAAPFKHLPERFSDPFIELRLGFYYNCKPDAHLPWKDPSPHTVRFVTVEKGVRLEVLDWGGSGRPLVLLAGGGDTAHVFDDFAPKLTPSFHVYGITRRGFGQSGFSPVGYGAERLGDDVLAVLDELKLEKPILVGHSLGGEELSSVATRYPSRVAALVYLEAGYPYAFDNGKGPTMREIEDASKLRPVAASLSDSKMTFAELQQAYARAVGFTYPESELRQLFITAPDGRVGKERDFPGGAVMLQGMKKYADIPVPALAIFAIPHAQPRWMTESKDPKVREAAQASSAAIDALAARQAKAFEEGVPTARVVRLPGADHYVYLSNEADVLREMKAFLSTLR